MLPELSPDTIFVPSGEKATDATFEPVLAVWSSVRVAAATVGRVGKYGIELHLHSNDLLAHHPTL